MNPTSIITDTTLSTGLAAIFLQGERDKTKQLAIPELLKHFPDSLIQFFDDTGEKDRSKALTVDHYNAEQVARKQQQNCGVFFSPNGFNKQRRKEQLIRLQAFYVDLDCAKEGDGTEQEELATRKCDALQAFTEFTFPPHLINDTKNGLQVIWSIAPIEDMSEEVIKAHQEVEEALITIFDADPGAKDVTRVLRLPSTMHLKDPKNPFECCLVWNQLGQSSPYEFLDILKFIRSQHIVEKENAEEQSEQTKAWQGGISGVGKGSRHTVGVSLAGKILHGLPEELWGSVGWKAMEEWNDHNDPPLDQKELCSMFEGIAKSEAKRKRKASQRKVVDVSQAQFLLAAIEKEDCTLFHDQFNEPYIRFPVENHFEIWKTSSAQCKRWLSQMLWKGTGNAPSAEALKSALNVIEAKACFEGEQIHLENRITLYDGDILYDLADRGCRAIRIGTNGWEIVDHPPILFRRFSHQEGQVQPKKGGSVDLLLDYINITDRDQQMLLLVYLVSCFIPNIPHPIPNLHGPQGSAKTTCARLLRMIVDPSKMPVLSFSSSIKELVQKLSHHYYAPFDNLTDISEPVSDLLCRAVTGEGFSKRQLYTDDEDVIYTFRRCIVFNGINPTAKKADLLDRSILVKLERISEEDRREEQDVLTAFTKDCPMILGAIFDAVAEAMQIYPTIKLERLPRMADFARWGCAIARALGYTQDEFLSVYYANIAEQHEEAIRENPVSVAIEAFMVGQTEEWSGSMTELLGFLDDVAVEEKIDTKAKDWPKAANILSRRLNEARTNLTEIGITISLSKDKTGKRIVTINREAGDDMEMMPTDPEEIQAIFSTPGDVSKDGTDDTVDTPFMSKDALPF